MLPREAARRLWARAGAPRPATRTCTSSPHRSAGSRGVQVFPRIPQRGGVARGGATGERLSTGIPGLDEMMGGGIPAGNSVVLAGSTGTGKTTFASLFVASGLRAGESAVVAIFEEHPDEYLQQASRSGVDFRKAMHAGKLRVLYLRPLDLSVDETMEAIRDAVTATGATRVVIDSISGFEMALAPTFREDFRESLYRLIGTLTALGVTVYLTVEVVETNDGLRFTGYQVSFLTDNIVSQRFVEIEGALVKALTVVKMRSSDHSRDFRAYEITRNGVQLRESLRDYDGIISGSPTRKERLPPVLRPGLTEEEAMVLETVIRAGSGTRRTLAEQTGLTPGQLDPILDRLVRLGYASRQRNVYRGVAQPRGP